MWLNDMFTRRWQRRLERRLVDQMKLWKEELATESEETAESESTEHALELFAEFERLSATKDAIRKGSSVDLVYANLLKQRLGELPAGDRYAIRNITIIGELENGDYAWESDDGTCIGHTPLAFFETDSVSSGDRFRVRIFSHLWGHRLEALLPTLHAKTPSESAAPPSQPTSDGARPPVAPVYVPESVRGTWREELQRGDLVYVNISFDDGVDKWGRTNKSRPAVFIRWRADYAEVRPYYKKNGFLDKRGRGTRAVGPKKDGIVRDKPVDVYPEKIERKMGRLSDDDLVVINLGSRKQPVLTQHEVGVVDFSQVPKPSEYTAAMNRVIESAKSFAWPGYEADALLILFMRSCRTDPEIKEVMFHHAVPYSALGDSYRQLCDQLGVDTNGKRFGNRLKDILFDVNRNERFVFETRSDAGQLPWLVLIDTRPGDDADVV